MTVHVKPKNSKHTRLSCRGTKSPKTVKRKIYTFSFFDIHFNILLFCTIKKSQKIGKNVTVFTVRKSEKYYSAFPILSGAQYFDRLAKRYAKQQLLKPNILIPSIVTHLGQDLKSAVPHKPIIPIWIKDQVVHRPCFYEWSLNFRFDTQQA